MSKDIYWEGYGVGRRAAGKRLAAINDARGISGLGSLAGRCLDEETEHPQFLKNHTFGRSVHWRTGYFEGFLDRAVEARSAA